MIILRQQLNKSFCFHCVIRTYASRSTEFKFKSRRSFDKKTFNGIERSSTPIERIERSSYPTERSSYPTKRTSNLTKRTFDTTKRGSNSTKRIPKEIPVPASSSGNKNSTTMTPNDENNVPRENELPKYKDSYLLSDRIKILLAKGDRENAEELLKHQYIRIQTAAVWNLLLSYDIQNGHLNKGRRIFNDMKKRGIKPNEASHTLIMACKSPKDAREYLENIPNYNIKHINQILQMYLEEKNFDDMWELYGLLKLYGPTSPDKYTYTIMFRGMQSRPFVDILFMVNRMSLQCKNSTYPEEIVDDMVARNLVRAMQTAVKHKHQSMAIAMISKLYNFQTESFSDISDFHLPIFKVTTKDLDTILFCCDRINRKDQGLKFLEQARKTIKPDLYVYHKALQLLLVGYTGTRNPTIEALKIYQMMLEDKVNPIDSTYDRLIGICACWSTHANSAWSDAKQIWDEMINRNIFNAPNVSTCSALLRCAKKKAERSALEAAFSRLNDISFEKVIERAINGHKSNSYGIGFLEELKDSCETMKRWRKSDSEYSNSKRSEIYDRVLAMTEYAIKRCNEYEVVNRLDNSE